MFSWKAWATYMQYITNGRTQKILSTHWGRFFSLFEEKVKSPEVELEQNVHWGLSDFDWSDHPNIQQNLYHLHRRLSTSVAYNDWKKNKKPLENAGTSTSMTFALDAWLWRKAYVLTFYILVSWYSVCVFNSLWDITICLCLVTFDLHL